MIWPFRKDPLDEYWQHIEWDDSFTSLIDSADDFDLFCHLADLVKQERGSDFRYSEKSADL